MSDYACSFQTEAAATEFYRIEDTQDGILFHL